MNIRRENSGVPFFSPRTRIFSPVFQSRDCSVFSRRRVAAPALFVFYVQCDRLSRGLCDASQVFKELEWCLYTSANLSQTAWGTVSRKPRNYEAGVLYHSRRLANTRKVTCRTFTRDRRGCAGNPTHLALPFRLPFIPSD
ncbi:BTE_collapsed_G0004100.mRNA.1.CDS.1 [Saccharomyces cerevisiae]|nr:BTE_collapsed_G0004100.mRNA.1.CDS.1 [Saccharomyces cerevisiae]